MEASVDASPSRDLGVACWVAGGRLNGADARERGRLRAWRALAAGHPMHESAPHFAPARSVAVFDAADRGAVPHN